MKSPQKIIMYQKGTLIETPLTAWCCPAFEVQVYRWANAIITGDIQAVLAPVVSVYDAINSTETNILVDSVETDINRKRPNPFTLSVKDIKNQQAAVAHWTKAKALLTEAGMIMPSDEANMAANLRESLRLEPYNRAICLEAFEERKRQIKEMEEEESRKRAKAWEDLEVSNKLERVKRLAKEREEAAEKAESDRQFWLEKDKRLAKQREKAERLEREAKSEEEGESENDSE
jgi:hypothetical protein